MAHLRVIVLIAQERHAQQRRHIRVIKTAEDVAAAIYFICVDLFAVCVLYNAMLVDAGPVGKAAQRSTQHNLGLYSTLTPRLNIESLLRTSKRPDLLALTST
jgi:hypothetical protein